MSPATNSPELPDFLQKLFTRARAEEQFSRLCESGCAKNDLAILLLAGSVFAVSNGGQLFDPGGLSTRQLTRLRKDLLSLAGLVDRINKSSLNPKFDFLWAPLDDSRDALRRTTADLYDMLPGLMQTYCVHLEQFLKFARANLRRMTCGHLCALKLPRYIQEKTGSPHYEYSSNLLIGGFNAVWGDEADPPDFFAAEALAKLNQRTSKLLPGRFSKAVNPSR